MARDTVFKLHRLLIALLMLMAGRQVVAQSGPGSEATQQINPPFGLEWGNRQTGWKGC